MTENASFVDVHIIQPVPYANLNRDDTNSPKTLMYGGCERSRISSQSWKRETRHETERLLGISTLRTRRVPEKVAEILVSDHDFPADLAAKAGRQVILSAAYNAKENKGLSIRSGMSQVMLFVPDAAITELAQIAATHRSLIEQAPGSGDTDDSAEETAVVKPRARKSAVTNSGGVLPTEQINAVLKRSNASVAAFGRMLAELPETNVLGAVQIAHAFTTHGTDLDTDFFTAVDDLSRAWGDNRGAAHMDSAAHTAGVYYRYASINVAELIGNLHGDASTAQEVIKVFLTAFTLTMPQGKKNSTAPFTLPDLVYMAVRNDRPVSMAGAFEAPTPSTPDGGWSIPSQQRLARYAKASQRFLSGRGIATHGHIVLAEDAGPLDGIGECCETLDELVARTVDGALPIRVPA